MSHETIGEARMHHAEDCDKQVVWRLDCSCAVGKLAASETRASQAEQRAERAEAEVKAVRAAGQAQHEHIVDRYRESLRDAESRVSALTAEVERLTRERDEARFRPLGDNHHNAAACPHCSPKSAIVASDSARAVLAERVGALEVELRHARWVLLCASAVLEAKGAEGSRWACRDEAISISRLLAGPFPETPATPPASAGTPGAGEPTLAVGAKVRKVGGTYEADGTVVGSVVTSRGDVRHVFEFAACPGMLHIFNGSQLRAAKPDTGSPP